MINSKILLLIILLLSFLFTPHPIFILLRIYKYLYLFNTFIPLSNPISALD